ncbi:hypothetical protein ACJMK2_015872 [Sinanodonta woodiana]|uniref:Cysteine and tyrosine-rich protein 1 n=1 Tax=Sinanodonta woodiana TaxID=1069815 RepID=A0ABD3URT6_SINWO
MFYFYFLISYSLFINAIPPVEAGDFCQYDYGAVYYRSKYCDYGCCGSKYSSSSSVCCTENVAGIIAGAVVGSLVGLAIIIGIIVCCCIAANNSKRRTGTVIQQPNTTQNVVVNSTTVTTQGPSTIPAPYGPVNYGYPGSYPAPAYYQYNNMPQGSTDPAYPPPPPAKY